MIQPTSWRLATVSAPRSDGDRILTIWKPSRTIRITGMGENRYHNTVGIVGSVSDDGRP